MSGTRISLSPKTFNNFGELLKDLRERSELSQRELALQVGYHYSYMSRIEKNERLPDSATLMARFIPALGLEDEPKWTERLLKQQLSISLAGVAWILYEGGDYEGATSTLGKALAIATRADDTRGISHTLHSLGTIHRYSREYDEAIKYMEFSHEVSAKIGNRQAQATTLANLSILYNLKEEYAKSEQCAERAFAIYQAIGSEHYQPFVMRMMGYAARSTLAILYASRVLIQESLRVLKMLQASLPVWWQQPNVPLLKRMSGRQSLWTP